MFEFDLVPEDPGVLSDERRWLAIRYVLIESQVATRVALVGEPPTRIRVCCDGGPSDLARDLVPMIEERAGTAVRLELRAEQ